MHKINSTYRQFYVADAGLEPLAPEEWTDKHIKQRFNSLKNIVALCTEGDITARIITLKPDEVYKSNDKPDFVVNTHLAIETGSLGIFEWPWEKLEEFQVTNGNYNIKFSGYNLVADKEENDYYVVEISSA